MFAGIRWRASIVTRWFGVVVLAACATPLQRGMAALDAGESREAFVTLEPLAQAGDETAQYLVGVILDAGGQILRDRETAAAWYRAAAEQGHAAAQNNLGVLCYTGDGVERSYSDAREWFARAAAQGFAKAQNNLGVMTMLGQAGPVDHAAARSLLADAADGGDTNAARTLATIYWIGDAPRWEVGLATPAH